LVETPSDSSDERPGLAGEETVRYEPRRDTLAASASSDFRHGRFEPGQRLGSRYRIVARLGEGGMGEVYRADDLELGQSVALKFLPERVATDLSWLRRFRNEVRTARQIAHPNVCRIYDIGQEDGHIFLSMEYIDGEDLAGVLRRLGRPSPEKAIELARQICLGLAAAHESKVLHHDLKPANIMIDGRGRVRITDFGLAGFLDELEGVEARAGTPSYMAPEQLAHGRVSVRSDVYALGLILHELFTGKCVFDTHDVEELKRRHSSGAITRPSSSTTEGLDPVVERVIMRCLEQQPEDRPQSVYQVLAALPGSDPLAAAVAAGETPSPELVANARDAEGLRPAVGLGLVATLVVSVAAIYVVSSGKTVMPDRPPTRLSVVAEQVLEKLGYGDLPRYSVSGYDGNEKLQKSLRGAPQSFDVLQRSTWPPKYRYWRRWSNGGFLPSDDHFPAERTIDGPTHDEASTVTVALDSGGRLLALSVPAAIAGAASGQTDQEDWSALFELARLNQTDMTQVAPNRSPPAYCDSVVAWRVDASPGEATGATVLMGAINGQPNYLEYLGLHDDMSPNHADLRLQGGVIGMLWMFFAGCMVLLAVRNLRAGRADYRNAFKCALLVGCLYVLTEVIAIPLSGSHVVGQVIGLSNGRAAGHYLIHAVEVWIYYLALEPYVRRVWPRMLIGLMRVFSGRWRDPAIGREVLIGVTTGCVLAAVVHLVAAADSGIAGRETAHLASPIVLRMLLSPGHYLTGQAQHVAWAVLSGVCWAGVVVLIRLIARHTVISAALSIAVIGLMDADRFSVLAIDSQLARVVFALGIGGCLVWLYSRVGVLAAFLFYFIVLSMGLFGFAFDAWSTPYLVAWFATLATLAVYGFWVSLGGQSIFKDMLADSDITS